VHPVVMADGHVYEEKAIRSYIEKQDAAADGRVRSPVTTLMMSAVVTPCLTLQAYFREMVVTDAWTGADVEAWIGRIKEEKEVAKYRLQAAAGCADAKCELGKMYRDGTHGLPQDVKHAFDMFKAAREADPENPKGIVNCGVGYMMGKGTEKDQVEGLALLSMAADMGSEHAMWCLGCLFTPECACVPHVDRAIARHWFGRMTSASVVDSSEDNRKQAAIWMKEYEAEGPSAKRQKVCACFEREPLATG